LLDFIWLLRRLDLLGIIDILLVAAVIYGVLFLMRGTQAVNLLRGVLTLVILAALLVNLLHLTAFNWLARNSLPALLVGIPVIFQPELRRALERLGRAGSLLPRAPRPAEASAIISKIAQSSRILSERRHGALIVLEQEDDLQNVAATGVTLDAELRAELLLSIFFPDNPLHDQATIVRGDRILAARCLLPLAEEWPPERQVGTRHRAAVGITEETDAIVVVISEETGIISLAHNGRLIRRLDEARLSRILHALYEPPMSTGFSLRPLQDDGDGG
jgi:diadenylate cyclase